MHTLVNGHLFLPVDFLSLVVLQEKVHCTGFYSPDVLSGAQQIASKTWSELKALTVPIENR